MNVLLLQQDAPSMIGYYAYYVIFFVLLYFLFQVFENWYAARFNKPLFRHLLVYKKLSGEQVTLLENEIPFYKQLSPKLKKQYRHRVANFIQKKEFVGREELVVDEAKKTLIAAIACKLSFGRKNYTYKLMDYILVYPGNFYSNTNEAFHKGEFNPREKTLVLSWEAFENGYKVENDNINLGLHEFMHAMHIEAKIGKDIDSARFIKQMILLLKTLSDETLKQKLDETRYFRAYAFTNQYEFMAVLAEYYFESPKELEEHFPKVYGHIDKMLNLSFAFT